MAFIDGSLVNIALPVIGRELGADIAGLQWVVNSYLLMLGALMLIGGGLGDRVGRRRIFLIGIVVFTAASIVCALAPTVTFLVAARVVQGIGAALLVPQSLALIASNFPKDVRGRAIGTWAAAASVTTAIGPALGGFLIDLLSWRVAFWANIPIAAVAIWLTLTHVPESRDESATGPIDWGGAVLAVLGIGALTYGLVGLGDSDAAAWPNLAAVAAGIAIIAVFVLVERRAANPLMPPDLFRSPVFTAGNIVTVLLYGALSGSLFLLPFDLLDRRGFDAGEVGLIMLPLGLIIGLMARFMGALADTHGPRPFLTTGSFLVAVACGLLALTLPDLWLGVMAPLILLAVGMGIVVSPLTTAVMNAVPEAKTGAASGVNNSASRLAGVLAVAIIGAVASLVYLANMPDGAPGFGRLPAGDDMLRADSEAAFLTSYASGMALAAAWALVAAIAALLWVPKGAPTMAGD